MTEPPFIGRRTELDLIRERLSKPLQPAALAFEGPSGIGKTSLLQEARSLAPGRAVYVACRGSANATAAALRGLVDGLLPALPADVLDAADLGDALLRAHDARPDTERATLLLIDDVDEAAPPLVAVLATLVPHLTTVMTLSPGGDNPLPTRETLSLSGLERPDIEGLVCATTEREHISANLLDALMVYGDGNPLLVELLLHHERKNLDRLVEAHAPVMVAGFPTPPQMVRARFEALSEDERTLLAAIAILGAGTPPAQITAPGLLSAKAASEAIHTLKADGWLRTMAGGDHLVFANVLLREGVIRSMPPELSRRIHLKTAEHLYAEAPEASAGPVSAAVRHFRAAGDIKAALGALERALEAAHRAGSREQLITLYNDAIAVTEGVEGLRRRRTDFVERLGDLYVQAGDYAQAAAVYGKVPLSSGAITLRGRLGLCLLPLDAPRAAHVLMQVAPYIPLTYPHDFRWLVEAGVVWALVLTDRHYDAIRRSRDALSTLNEMDNYGAARTLLRAALGMALAYNGDPIDAQPHLEAARASWQARSDDSGLALVEKVSRAAPRAEVTRALLVKCLVPVLHR